MAKKSTWLLWLLAFIALVTSLTACTGDDGESGSVDADAEETSSTADSATDSTTETSESTSSTATTSTESTASTLPGEEFIGYVAEGDILGVVAVRHDDVLNIRALPGADQPVVTTANPTNTDLVATGRARLLPNSIWYEVTVDGTTGWANSRFLGHVAGTFDVTADFLSRYGARPAAETLTDLGELVAAEFASEDPPSEIVLTVAPSVGDLGEVTYDVIGIGDDSVLGSRLHIFAVETESGESFELTTIEETVFCMRGTAGEICT